MTGSTSPEANVPPDTLVTPDERSRRHQFRNELTAAAAQMQAAIEQVREAREALLGMLSRDEDTDAPPGQV